MIFSGGQDLALLDMYAATRGTTYHDHGGQWSNQEAQVNLHVGEKYEHAISSAFFQSSGMLCCTHTASGIFTTYANPNEEPISSKSSEHSFQGPTSVAGSGKYGEHNQDGRRHH